MSYSVAKNTSFLTAASILQKIISFVYFTFVARYIGVGNTGQYFFAIAFTTIFAVVADFGLASVLTRELSRHPKKTEKFVGTIFWTKIFFGLLAYGLAILAVNLLGYDTVLKHLIYLSGVTMFFDNLHMIFYSIFRARKNLVYESIGIVGSQFITLVVGTTAIVLGWPMIWLIAAYTIPSFLNFIYVVSFAKKVYKLRYYFVWDKQIFKWFFALAVPFALAALVGRLYSYSDSLLMSKMLTAQELGWWSVPYKITFAFQFIPAALSASVYPVMSSLYVQEKYKIAELFEKSWRYLFLLVFPLSFGLFILAEPVIIKLYRPDYYPSVAVLQILVISLIFGFLSLITGALLNATNRQKIQTGILFISLLFNIILNLFLLPRFGINGAAIAALASNILLCLAGLFFAGKEIQVRHINLFKYLNQAFWPALIMAGVVHYLSQKINFIYTIPLGGLVYGGLLFVTGGLSVSFIKKIFNKVFKE